MWHALRDQFPTTFMCLFLAWFLPWTMSWQYLDVPILTVQLLMALLFLGPIAQEHGLLAATKFGVVVGIALLAIGLSIFAIHQSVPRPPVLLFLGLFSLLAAASYLVSVIARAMPERAKLAAWVLLIGTYFLGGRVIEHETLFLYATAALCALAGFLMHRRYI